MDTEKLNLKEKKREGTLKMEGGGGRKKQNASNSSEVVTDDLYKK